MKIKNTVLVFLFNKAGDQVLLIEKKRGMGAGKWNGPGGKYDLGENAQQAAVRECFEESGLRPLDLKPAGLLEFSFPEDSLSQSWSNCCRVFTANSFEGDLVQETEECRNFWWPIAKIDFDKFWPDDRFWLPNLFKGQLFHRIYVFDRDNQIISEEIKDGPIEFLEPYFARVEL